MNDRNILVNNVIWYCLQMRTVRQGKHFKANRRFPNSSKGSSKRNKSSSKWNKKFSWKQKLAKQCSSSRGGHHHPFRCALMRSNWYLWHSAPIDLSATFQRFGFASTRLCVITPAGCTEKHWKSILSSINIYIWYYPLSIGFLHRKIKEK